MKIIDGVMFLDMFIVQPILDILEALACRMLYLGKTTDDWISINLFKPLQMSHVIFISMTPVVIVNEETHTIYLLQ
jgi:hypothetical protein